MNLPTLDNLREELETALAQAIQAGAPNRLSHTQARQAVHGVLLGQGVQTDVKTIFEGRPVCHLVCFDADQIQRWVFDSERVQVASGASKTLDGLNADIDLAVAEISGIYGKLYSAGGGGILIAGADSDATELAATTQRWLEERSHGLTFTVIAEPLSVSDLEPGSEGPPLPPAGVAALNRFRVTDGLRAVLVRTQIKLRTAKDAVPRFQAEPALRSRAGTRAERCPSCGRRPPRRAPVTDNAPEFWCGHCAGLRRQYQARGGTGFERDGQPITFGDLAEGVDCRRRYLGFLAVDGNSMGRVVQNVRSFLQLRAFSEATTAIYDAARRKAKAVVAGSPFKENLAEGCLSLLSGGDEITLVLPSTAAPAAAIESLRAIEQGYDAATRPGQLLHTAFESDPELLDQLCAAGAAAGLVVAHSHYPVRLLRQYANQLQKDAKRSCASNNQRSGLAWLLLTDSSPLTEALAEEKESGDQVLQSFERLVREAMAAREVAMPSSALQGILSHYRHEERELKLISGSSGEQTVLNLLTANFFRYQLARNEKLRSWWRQIAPVVEGGDQDAVASWLDQGGGRRLEKLVDLLSLDPLPVEQEMTR